MDIVLGGSGFIGSHLTEALLATGRKVRVLDMQPWKYAKNSNLEVMDVDIRGALPSFFGADRVFHLAALADIVPSIEDPVTYYDTNVTGTLNVLEECKRAGVKRLVYTASSSCYGLDGGINREIMPMYPYALTKHMGEQLVMHWQQIYKLSAVSLRLFNVYGPRSRTNGAYGAMFGVFLAQLANNKPLTIVGDGTQKRDFTYVSDVVDAILTSANSERNGIYDIGSGNPVSVNQIVEIMGSPPTVHIPKRPGEPDITFAPILKVKNDMGWEPKVSIQEGVKSMLLHLSDYKNAPLWDRESIEGATKQWFKALA